MAEGTMGGEFMRLARLAGRLDSTLMDPLWAEDGKPVGTLRQWVFAHCMPGLSVPWDGAPPCWRLGDGWVTVLLGARTHTLVPMRADVWWTPGMGLRLWGRAAKVGHHVANAGGLDPYWSQWHISGGRLTVTAASDGRTRVTASSALTRMGYPLMLRLLALRARALGTPDGDRLVEALGNAGKERH